MNNQFNSIKAAVANFENENGGVNWIKAADSAHTKQARALLCAIKDKEKQMLDAGYTLVRTPIHGGYSEKWVAHVTAKA